MSSFPALCVETASIFLIKAENAIWTDQAGRLFPASGIQTPLFAMP